MKDIKEISKYDYKKISNKIDNLYNELLYRDIYPNCDREKSYKELIKNIEFFKRLPLSNKITKLKYLNRIHDLYLGNLYLCDGEIAKAIKQYLKVISIRQINQKVKDIRSKKCSRIELCDLMPLIYNIEEMLKLCGLDDKAKEYISLCNQAIIMWEDVMKEDKPKGIVIHSLKDNALNNKTSYEKCCEEYFDKNTGRTNYRFNSGLDDYELIIPEIIEKDNKKYYKLRYISDLIDVNKLKTVEAAKIIGDLRIA